MAVLPTPGSPTKQRVVLLAAAQHLDGALDLGVAPDQRVDLALARLLVEVDVIGLERVGLLLLATALVRAAVGAALFLLFVRVRAARRLGWFMSARLAMPWLM